MQEKDPKQKSLLDNIREINAREKKEALEAESKAAEKKARVEQKSRESYQKKLQNERVQLLRAKQGISEQPDEKQVNSRQAEQVKYTFKQKLSNFVYHYKIGIIAAIIIIPIAAFLTYDILSKENPDITIMVVAQDSVLEASTEKLAEILTPYCDDYNGDGKTVVSVLYAPTYTDETSDAEMYSGQATQARVIAEFQSDNVVMMISSDAAIKHLGIEEGIFEDMTAMYPDDENATEVGYNLLGTKLYEQLGYTEKPEGLYMSLRIPKSGFGLNYEKFTENYDNALKVWEKYFEDNKVE